MLTPVPLEVLEQVVSGLEILILVYLIVLIQSQLLLVQVVQVYLCLVKLQEPLLMVEVDMQRLVLELSLDTQEEILQ